VSVFHLRPTASVKLEPPALMRNNAISWSLIAPVVVSAANSLVVVGAANSEVVAASCVGLGTAVEVGSEADIWITSMALTDGRKLSTSPTNVMSNAEDTAVTVMANCFCPVVAKPNASRILKSVRADWP